MQDTTKTDVNAIWQQLNARSKPTQSKQSFDKLWFGFTNDVARPKLAGALRPSTTPVTNSHAQEPTTCRRTQSTQRQQQADKSNRVDASSSVLHGSGLERCINMLQDPEARNRRSALQTIKVNRCLDGQRLYEPPDMQGVYVHVVVSSFVLQSAATLSRTSPDNSCVQDAFTASPSSQEQSESAMQSNLGKALLRKFDDKSEACRELAISCFMTVLSAAPDSNLQLLPYTMPVLEERLQLVAVGRCDDTTCIHCMQ